MKKLKVIASLVMLLLLTGCKTNINKSGIHIENGNTYTNYDWPSLVFFFVIGVFWIVIIVGFIRRFIVKTRKDIWETTTATILDDVVAELEKEPKRSRRMVVVYPDIKVEYYVAGTRYEKYLNAAELMGCTDTVEIQYLKDKPHVIRKAKSENIE